MKMKSNNQPHSFSLQNNWRFYSKMNRLDFTELVAAFKRGSSKGVGFKPAKLRNFDGVKDRKVVDVWLTEMEDYLHATKVGRHLVVELTQSYLKGYASTWWKTVRHEERKTHGYTWEFFKKRIELKFIPKNSDYISRCKFRDLVNVTNDNLCQYARVYFEFMLEMQHMHRLDCVCHFVMGLLTWAKCKLEENWPVSLSEAIMEVEGFLDVRRGEKSRFKKENKFLHKKAHKEGEWNRGQDTSKGEKPKQFQAWDSNPKEVLSRRGFLLKQANPRGVLVRSPKERVSIVMKWGIIPKIAPNSNRGMGVVR